MLLPLVMGLLSLVVDDNTHLLRKVELLRLRTVSGDYGTTPGFHGPYRRLLTLLCLTSGFEVLDIHSLMLMCLLLGC